MDFRLLTNSFSLLWVAKLRQWNYEEIFSQLNHFYANNMYSAFKKRELFSFSRIVKQRMNGVKTLILNFQLPTCKLLRDFRYT